MTTVYFHISLTSSFMIFSWQHKQLIKRRERNQGNHSYYSVARYTMNHCTHTKLNLPLHGASSYWTADSSFKRGQYFPALKEPTLDRKGPSLGHTMCQLNASNTAIPHFFNIIHKRSLPFRFSDKTLFISPIHHSYIPVGSVFICSQSRYLSKPSVLTHPHPMLFITIRSKLLHAYNVNR